LKLVQGPYTGDNLRHPVFGLDVRSMKRAWHPSQFVQTSRRLVLIVHLVIIAIWILLGVLIAGPRTPNEFDMYAISSVNLIAFASIFLDIILDFICLQGAVKTISGEITAGRWDLLRLTALSESGIVRAKHAGARLRVWRATLIVASVRVTTISLILLGGLIVPFILYGRGPLGDDFFNGLIYQPVATILALVVVAITAVVYVVEPFWRARAMTALGMVLSAYIQSVPMALLAGLGAIFAVWLVQIIIVIALVLGLGIGLGTLFSPLMFGSSALVVALYLLISCLITAVTIYGFYSLVQTWSLRRVWNRILNAN
jgi:hypothetical protein